MRALTPAAAVRLLLLPPGTQARVTTLGEAIDPAQRLRLLAYGLAPGSVLRLLRQRPMTVVMADEVEVALENALARDIWVRPC